MSNYTSPKDFREALNEILKKEIKIKDDLVLNQIKIHISNTRLEVLYDSIKKSVEFENKIIELIIKNENSYCIYFSNRKERLREVDIDFPDYSIIIRKNSFSFIEYEGLDNENEIEFKYENINLKFNIFIGLQNIKDMRCNLLNE